MTMRGVCVAGVLFALGSGAQAQGVCTLIVPESVTLEPSPELTKAECKPGFVCELASCEGWVTVTAGAGAVQVVFRNNNNRSEVREVVQGRPLHLQDLNAGDSLTSAIGSLLRALLGGETGTVAAGRFAIQPGAGAQAVPAGQIAVSPGEALAFSVEDAAGAAYVFRAADASAGDARVVADAAGVFRIDAASLPPGSRLRGGLEGGAEVSFQVAPADKLARVVAELESGDSLSEEGERFRRALIFSDNGLAWNARQELAGLGEDE